ncbi:Classical arabinogalactan protein 26 [Rhynchospora pubera]|uniref:Classical arabinogalactan protein 26 n=1 Tax=Rhynchospora pubera TaxID=906938 RepID=A0AAV8GGL3_9POAL|nr:Classical arabinogalactan protein 26 [Rhynchospora pubera]KAJ4802178.1 Classical arabinogalactan protein 26 [Rhynchospora pubera]
MTLMAPFLPSKLLISAILSLLLFATFKPSLSYLHETTSSISVAPSYLPKMPKISYMAPTLPPDIMPVFPSPGTATGEAPSSNLPTIPSSPSPPNPDDLEPNSAFAPFGSMATATSSAGSLGDASRVPVAFASVFVVLLWWLVVGR